MSATHIIRVVSGPPDRVSVPLATANNNVLSLRARGLLLYLMAQGDDARIDVATIASECPEGRDAVYSAMSELKAAGYMRRKCYQGGRGRMEWVTEVADDPAILTTATVSALPPTGAPFTGDPETAQPQTVDPERARTVNPGRRPSVESPPTRVLLSPPPYSEEDIPATIAAGGFAHEMLTHLSASFGGGRVTKAGGAALAWAGQIVGLLGDWTNDDAAAAIVIWDAFRRSDKWRFKGANPTGWPTFFGDWYANDYRPTVKGPSLRVRMDVR